MICRIALITVFLFTLNPHVVLAAEERFLDILEVTSPGGITAWLVEDHSVPVIAVKFAFAGAGSVVDPEAKQGLVQLASNMMDEGAGDLDSQSFQKTLADHSITLHYDVGRDDYYGTLKTLTREKDKAFDLLRLSLTVPRFDDEPLQRMKDANIARIRSSLSDPDWMAARILNDVIYAGHPYARNSGGTITGLKSVTADDLRGFVKNHLARDNLRIAVTGDITRAELEVFLDKTFGALTAKSAPVTIADTTVQNAGQTALFKKDLPQTIIQMAQTGINRKDPDWHAAQTMNFILGSAGFGSRLMEEIREKRGLTYGIYTGLNVLDHVAVLSIGTSTRNDQVAEVTGLIRQEWVKMRDTPVTKKELDDAKAYLIGSMPLSLSSTDQIAGMMLSIMLDDLPITYLDDVDDKIAAITIADITRVSKRLLNPEQLVTILVGNPSGITPTRIIEDLPNVE
ncbi:MAG: M16 family metallopeptidase [Micavibrio sp.]